MASQSTTGTAVQYERMLIQHIRNLQGDVDINSLIAEKLPSVETAVNFHFSRLAKPKEGPPIQRQTFQGAGPRPKFDDAKRRDKQVGANRPQTGEKRVCLFHNPRDNKKCKFGDKCPFEHVDTTKEENKKRFEKARAARRN